MPDNTQRIVDNALCIGCGACHAICPCKAISMTEHQDGSLIAFLDEKRCIDCARCLSICPSSPNRHVGTIEADLFLGHAEAAYIGYANNPIIRSNSQSGGLVTALLIYMKKQSVIENAVVNCFDPVTCFPKVLIAKSEAEILKSAGSYYVQTPVVQKIIENNNANSAAVVLGCHAESLKYIEEKCPHITLPKYVLGLICAGQNKRGIIDEFVRLANCSKRDVANFRFKDKRYGRWPGDVHIHTKYNEYTVAMQKRKELFSLFEVYRCLLCNLKLNQHSDLVFGDPWGIQLDDINKGYTVVIARTNKGNELLRKAIAEGVVSAKEINVDVIIRGQFIDSYMDRFYDAYSVSKDNGWALPYKDSFCSDDRPARRRRTFRRLLYARKAFYATDNGQRTSLARRRVLQLRLERISIACMNKVKNTCSKFLQKVGRK